MRSQVEIDLAKNASWPMHFGWMVCIACVMLGCQSSGLNTSALDDQSTLSTKPTERIESLVGDWFLYIEDPSHVSPDLMDFLDNDDVVLRSNDETIRGRQGVLDWIAEMNHRFARVEFQIGPVEVLQEELDLLHVRFEVDRRAWDVDGLLHLSRSHYSWRIEVGRQNALRLLDAEERAALFHPGTGTQILCL